MKNFKYILIFILSGIVFTVTNATANYNIDYFSHTDKNNITINTYANDHLGIAFPYQGDRIAHAEVILTAIDNTVYTVAVAEQELSCTNKICRIEVVTPIKEPINNLATIIIELSTDNFLKEITILNKLILTTKLPILQLSFDTANNTFEHKIITPNELITYNASIIPPTRELIPNDENNTISTDELITHNPSDTPADPVIKKNNTTSAIIAGATALLTGTTIIGGVLIKKNITKNQIALTDQITKKQAALADQIIKNKEVTNLYNKQKEEYENLQNLSDQKEKSNAELHDELALQKKACGELEDKVGRITKYLDNFDKETEEKMVSLILRSKTVYTTINQKKIDAEAAIELIRTTLVSLESDKKKCPLEKTKIHNKLDAAVHELALIEKSRKFSNTILIEITTKIHTLTEMSNIIENLNIMAEEINRSAQTINTLTSEALALARQCKPGSNPETTVINTNTEPEQIKTQYTGANPSSLSENSPQKNEPVIMTTNTPNTICNQKEPKDKKTANDNLVNEAGDEPQKVQKGGKLIFSTIKGMFKM